MQSLNNLKYGNRLVLFFDTLIGILVIFDWLTIKKV